MPKLVKELPQGKAFGRSAEGGTLADTATRVWKIIMDSPTESFDISSAIGVQIGDPLDNVNPIPCVSIDVKGDGESRMVRIVTAQYRTSGMVGSDEGGTGLPDPMLVMPDIRPANFSSSTSLYEMPAVRWAWPGGAFEAVRNPAGDPVDNVTKLEPITTIRVTQFNFFPGLVFQGHAGSINSEDISFGSMTFKKHTLMFRGVEATPHVETHGIAVFSGFMNSYEFAYRRNRVNGIIEGDAFDFPVDKDIGWDLAVIVEGFNCIAFNPASPTNEQDRFGQPLAIDTATQAIKANPYALPEGIEAGEKVRAMVKIVNYESGKAMQNPSAMPIALNKDGTPRKLNAANKPLVWQRQVQPEIDLVNTLQLRIG